MRELVGLAALLMGLTVVVLKVASASAEAG